MPESHLSRDIAQEVRVMGNDPECVTCPMCSELSERRIEPAFEGWFSRRRPVANITAEELISECAAPTEQRALARDECERGVERTLPHGRLRVSTDPIKRVRRQSLVNEKRPAC